MAPPVPHSWASYLLSCGAYIRPIVRTHQYGPVFSPRCIPPLGTTRRGRKAAISRLFSSEEETRQPSIHHEETSSSLTPAKTSTKRKTKRREEQERAKGSPRTKTMVWPTRCGRAVRIIVEEVSGKYLEENQKDEVGEKGMYFVKIMLENVHGTEERVPQVVWGMYRSSPSIWQSPEAVIPEGSQKDDALGAIRTPMSSHTEPSSGLDTWTAEFSVPIQLAPMTFAFLVDLPPSFNDEDDASSSKNDSSVLRPLLGEHFSVLLGLGSGQPSPPGPSLIDSHTVNFSVRARGGSGISLVLLKPPKPMIETNESATGSWKFVEISLDPVLNKTGDQWHIAVPGIKRPESVRYGWRVDGDISWESGFRIQPDIVLLDPYAPSLSLYPTTPAPPLPVPHLSIPEVSVDGVNSDLYRSSSSSLARRKDVVALSALDVSLLGGDEEGTSPPLSLPLESLKVLEIDPRTFAQGPQVSRAPGTFLGVTERIKYLQALGVNGIVLGSSYSTSMIDVGDGVRAAPTTFMAPDPALSTDPSSARIASEEFKSMVARLHAAGIEVIVAMDTTFVADGTDDASSPCVSLRGLDYPAYFRPNGVMNFGSPSVQSLLLSAMRRWTKDFGVDGFLFLNAENLSQDVDGTIVDAPSFVEAACKDPVLQRLKLIAAPSDPSLLPRNGARGFPHWGLWQQRNYAFQRDIFSFIAENTVGMLDAVAMRLTGSADIFAHCWEEDLPGNLAIARRPSFSFNAATKPMRDGSSSVASLAEEAAGSAGAAAVAAMGSSARVPSAMTIAKSILVAVILSQGVPVISQEDVENVEMARFVGILMRLRRKFAGLLLPPLFDSPRDITWYGVDGNEPRWNADIMEEEAMAGSNVLALMVKGLDGSAVLVAFNPHPLSVSMVLPRMDSMEGGTRTLWKRAVDTSLSAPEDAELEMEGFVSIEAWEYTMAAKAAIVLVSGPIGE